MGSRASGGGIIETDMATLFHRTPTPPGSAVHGRHSEAGVEGPRSQSVAGTRARAGSEQDRVRARRSSKGGRPKTVGGPKSAKAKRKGSGRPRTVPGRVSREANVEWRSSSRGWNQGSPRDATFPKAWGQHDSPRHVNSGEAELGMMEILGRMNQSSDTLNDSMSHRELDNALR